MADYWKSQARKFCDFCKCWIADNKPSIQFHESGKRHKENVATRIAEITKKSAKAHKAEQEYKDDIRTMEEAALKAYMKDVATSADYTAQRILESQREKEKGVEDNVAEKVLSEEASTEGADAEEENVAKEKQWYEAKSDEGHTYYWNTISSESRWEPPEEGYLSIEEQQKETKQKKNREKVEKAKAKEAKKLKREEERARKAREEMKKRRVKDDMDKPANSKPAEITFGPAPKPDPYGSWTSVEKVVEQPLDLDLPEQQYIAVHVPEYTEPEIKFKEKTLTQLDGDDGEAISVFKKRKVNLGTKRGNMRQRLNDD